MKSVRGFQRKKPQILPPLANSQPILLQPVDPAQPFDLFLMENCLETPGQSLNAKKEFDNICDENYEKSLIRIKHCQKEREKHDLLTVDVILNPFCGKTKHSQSKTRKENDLKITDCKRKNLWLEKLSEKQFKKPDYTKPQESSWEQQKKTDALEPKVFQIPNRYTLLKPIGK